MKKILIPLVLLPASLWAQHTAYIIKGKTGAVNAHAKVYLSHENKPATIIDSAILQNGQFEFKGTITDPYPARLVFDYTDPRRDEYLFFYIEEGMISINTPDSFSKAMVEGSTVNADNEKLKTAVRLNEEGFQTYLSEWRSMHPGQKKMDSADLAEYNVRLKVNKEAKRQIYLDFIRQNPNSFISLDAIKYISGPIPDYQRIAPLFNSLSSDIRNTIAGKEYARLLNGAKATAIGEMAPAFTLNDPDGKPVMLSGFKGKYLLIDFWASWCGPCRAENPNLVKAFNKYHEKGLEILSVSFDDEKGKDAWLAAIKKDGLLWKNVSDLKGKNSEVAELYGIKAIPQNVLLDRTGKIIAKNLRGDALNKKLARIFP